MKLTEIPRIKAGTTPNSVRELEGLNNERAKIATRAADLLGYKVLANHMSGQTVSATSEGRLTETLRALEFEVLDNASVIKYQMEEAGRITSLKISEDFRQWTVGWLTAASWSHTTLTEYEQPIPEFVLDKALRIKERLPEVIFQVQHLNEPKADPFLIAHLGKEIYYIEAWDEPRFENTL